MKDLNVINEGVRSRLINSTMNGRLINQPMELLDSEGNFQTLDHPRLTLHKLVGQTVKELDYLSSVQSLSLNLLQSLTLVILKELTSGDVTQEEIDEISRARGISELIDILSPEVDIHASDWLYKEFGEVLGELRDTVSGDREDAPYPFYQLKMDIDIILENLFNWNDGFFPFTDVLIDAPMYIRSIPLGEIYYTEDYSVGNYYSGILDDSDGAKYKDTLELYFHRALRTHLLGVWEEYSRDYFEEEITGFLADLEKIFR